MIVNFSKRFIQFIIQYSDKEIEEDDVEVYIYGLECFINTAIVIIILLICGIFFRVFWETILWICTFSLIRHYIGGLHAPSEGRCIVSSILVGVTNYFAIYYEILNVWAFLFCLVVCILFAPTDISKWKLSAYQKKLFKVKAIMIVVIEGCMCFIIGQNTFTISIMHALVCASVLMTISFVCSIKSNL